MASVGVDRRSGHFRGTDKAVRSHAGRPPHVARCSDMRLIHAGAIALGTVSRARRQPRRPRAGSASQGTPSSRLSSTARVEWCRRASSSSAVTRSYASRDPRDALPANAQIVDLTRYTAIPGLIDLHTHMTYYWDSAPGTDPVAPASAARRSRPCRWRCNNALKTLETGRDDRTEDLGASNYTGRRAARFDQQGGMDRARACSSRDSVSSARAPALPAKHRFDEKRRAAAYINISQVAGSGEDSRSTPGVDYIKMYGFDRQRRRASPATRRSRFDEMKAAEVDAAHALGKAHRRSTTARTGRRPRRRARARTRSSTRSTSTARDARRDARAGGTALRPDDRPQPLTTPTNAKGLSLHRAAGRRGSTPSRARNFETARRAFKAGVGSSAWGSDAVSPAGFRSEHARARLVRQTRDEAPARRRWRPRATQAPPRCSAWRKSPGQIAPGYFADITAVEGDPLADINVVLTKVRWVMKGRNGGRRQDPVIRRDSPRRVILREPERSDRRPKDRFRAKAVELPRGTRSFVASLLRMTAGAKRARNDRRGPDYISAVSAPILHAILCPPPSTAAIGKPLVGSIIGEQVRIRPYRDATRDRSAHRARRAVRGQVSFPAHRTPGLDVRVRADR